MMTMQKAEGQLQLMGFRHAPIQNFLESPGVDGRCVTLGDPDGRYYLLGIDNGHRSAEREPRNVIQLMFFNVPDDEVGQVAARIGWVVTAIEDLPVQVGNRTMRSVMLAPAAVDRGVWLVRA